MEFTSILDLQDNPDKEQPRAAFFRDLNLNRVIEQICREWEEDVSSLYFYFPATRACEDYRREVFADVSQPSVYEALCGFTEGMSARREALEQKKRVHSLLQSQVWHVSEARRYCEALAGLEKALSEFPLKSGGLRNFYKYLKEYLKSEEFQKLSRDAYEVRGKLDGIRLILDYENGRISVSCGEAGGAYDKFLRESFSGDDRKLSGPFGTSADVSNLETEILKLVQKRQPEAFKAVEVFCDEHWEYASETLLRFEREIKFYLSFHCFERKMREEGFSFAAPKVEEDQAMYAGGLYDLALACAGRTERRPVVPNDMEYREGEDFFVLTGPNQGGKTTFARSLGQLIYFTKMGLDVPAKVANVHYFSSLLTHFSVEESVETGKGKLKEELTRLNPMMAASCENAYVVINELFTTAANYDACIMGKRVLEHFREARCRGIYVTHLRELTEGEGLVSLRAMLDEDGRRNFRIERSEAADSASAVDQVEKYHLTYEQLKERLGGFDGLQKGEEKR